MTKLSSEFSRRQFLLTAGASAIASVFLKGCVGNPPAAADLSPKAVALDLSPDRRTAEPQLHERELEFIGACRYPLVAILGQ